MKIPTFAQQQKAWASPPIDDVGYLPSAELLTWDDAQLLGVINQMAQSRYGGWRNWEMRWRIVLGLDSTQGKNVLDYGCGVGLEALQYAKAGNRVWVADIVETNVRLAERVLALEGRPVEAGLVIEPKPPYIQLAEKMDVIHCCGVLHHIPNPIPVVQEMSKWLVKNGELRLMVYSDEAWRMSTGTEPPESVVSDPNFHRYTRWWDAVGYFADWYDARRLRDRFGDWFRVAKCEPLTEHGWYLGAVLVKK